MENNICSVINVANSHTFAHRSLFIVLHKGGKRYTLSAISVLNINININIFCVIAVTTDIRTMSLTVEFLKGGCLYKIITWLVLILSRLVQRRYSYVVLTTFCKAKSLSSHHIAV